ncbi:MAG: NAD(P)H-dependent oxidoreductase, partial [Kiritimatiellae bacterium]|nr:NAD(P)H-dependent oxidoreductase [Kiritimatiellia bacterium]
MMVLIILAHPDPHSFNHAIANAASHALRQNGHHVLLHDLYQEQFYPILQKEEIPIDAPLLAVLAAPGREP